MIKNYALFIVALTILFSLNVWGAVSPLGICIVPPVQFPPEDFDIAGARISVIYGEHRNVYGLDIGVIGNVIEQKFIGLEVAGIFNLHQGPTTILGLQAAAMNFNNGPTTIVGLQVGLINSNTASSTLAGLEVGLLNLSPNLDTYGFQIGIYNKALNVHGFQIGVVNQAATLHGLQIGLLNIHEKGMVRISPILNFGF
jgi:hypothetical protein